CFLVLDASPHQNPEVIASLQRSIRLAAQKGIRIVPVSASGIAKDTEYLMKFFGMATNGTYVFLTNHSGVGGNHIEPDTDTYTVEAFNMLLVRIISEYTRQQRCDGQTAIRFDSNEQEPEQQALYYPNPVVDQMTLELPFDAEKVSVYNAEGASVLSLGKLAAGKHTLRLNSLPAGMYTMRIWKGGQVQTGKVMVVRT
ncbi:MAG: T9SS type A sorting domain-containing protein, partial [Saprospiraceae bacterium]|nr:T9SS type A sorting domain-containing protein [Saprospiraceae bacterium]